MGQEPYRQEFDSFSEFVGKMLAATGDISGSRDPRLTYKAVATGLHEHVGSEGGFLVPEEHVSEIWAKVLDTGSILRRCDRLPISRSNPIKIPTVNEASRADGSRFGGVRTYWVDEAEVATKSMPRFGLMTLTLHKLLGLVYATDELLQDVPALAGWLKRALALEIAFTVEDHIINGSGAGVPLGVLNAGATITVAKEDAQPAATVVPQNLVEMAARLWGPSHANAIWLMGNPAFKQIAGKSFSDGSPVVVSNSQGRTILGMPLELCECTKPLGSAGDVVLGDFGQFVVAEQNPDFISSVHLRFLEDQTAFKFRLRVDGQPGWSTSVTPKNSAISESPFVTLEAGT